MAFKAFNRNQLDMIGFSIDDFVSGGDAKCRFVVDIVSKLDLSKLYERYSSVGASAFEPSTLLASWFLGYCEEVTSTRKLEERCQYDVRFMYTCGNQRPDHSTLSRFRQSNIDLLSDYFVQILQWAQKRGISDFKTIAVDGTKIQAVASPSQSKDSDQLERRLKAIRRDISNFMEQCDESDLLESDTDEDDIDSIPRKLRKLRKLEETFVKRRRKLKERQKQLKKEHQADHRITISEPDAISMKLGRGQSKAPAYNAQVSVDTKTQLIVANDIVCERNDYDQFSIQHEAIEKNLGPDVSRQFVADSGYHTLEDLNYIDQNQIQVLLADPTPQNRSIHDSPSSVKELLKSGRPLHRADFHFDSDNDYYTCPQGHDLMFSGHTKSHGRRKRLYKANPDICGLCSLYRQCLVKPTKFGARTIMRDEHEDLAEAMLRKTLTENSKELMQIRAFTSEPVFGNIKANHGFRRFRLSGSEKVKGEFNLVAIAHNINKLNRIWRGFPPNFHSFLQNLSSKLNFIVSNSSILEKNRQFA